MILNENVGYHVGASVVCVEPSYKGIRRKIGIIDRILTMSGITHPYMVVFNNGLTCPQSKEEIIPLSWYLTVRSEALHGEFGDYSPSPRYTNEDF